MKFKNETTLSMQPLFACKKRKKVYLYLPSDIFSSYRHSELEITSARMEFFIKEEKRRSLNDTSTETRYFQVYNAFSRYYYRLNETEGGKDVGTKAGTALSSVSNSAAGVVASSNTRKKEELFVFIWINLTQRRYMNKTESYTFKYCGKFLLTLKGTYVDEDTRELREFTVPMTSPDFVTTSRAFYLPPPSEDHSLLHQYSPSLAHVLRSHSGTVSINTSPLVCVNSVCSWF